MIRKWVNLQRKEVILYNNCHLPQRFVDAQQARHTQVHFSRRCIIPARRNVIVDSEADEIATRSELSRECLLSNQKMAAC